MSATVVPAHAPRFERGYTYLVLMVFLAVLALAAALTVELVQTSCRREAEAELLAIGKEFERAFASYYRQSGPGQRQYPERLEDLLRDPRVPGVRRHLRRLYVDPVSGQPWRTVAAPQGGIMAVHSSSEERPFKEYWPSLALPPLAAGSLSAAPASLPALVRTPAASAPQATDPLPPASSYAQWRFGYDPAAERARHIILPSQPAASAAR